MSNPWAKTFEDLRSPYLAEKKAKKDYDGDGKIESGTDEYKGSVDKAIKKNMGKSVKEHHQKDADGKVIEHEGEGTPASVEEGAPYTVNVADKTGNTPAYQNFKKGMLNKLTGKPLYKAGVGLDKAHYEPAPVKAGGFSNWKEEMHWEALKGKKLDIDDSGSVKNKIEINPDVKTEEAKSDVKKPKKAQDAGARGRRLLMRKEYKAKVSEFVPKELEDSVQYDENLKDVGAAIKGGLNKIKTKVKDVINRPVMPNYPTKKQYQDSIKQGTSNQYMSYEPEGEMIDEMGKKFGTQGNTLGDASDKVMKKLKDGTPVKKIDKKIKKLNMGEAKIDTVDPKNKRKRRNERQFGKQTKPYDPDTKEMKTSMGKFMNSMRHDMHDKKRGVKTKGVKKEEVVIESDKKGSGSGTKDACYHKVKSRYSVWPSAYASGALVKCRKKGAKNWGNSSKKEDFNWDFEMKSFGAIAAECWKTHKQEGLKKKGNRMVPNCVPKNEERTPAAGDKSFDIMRPGGANSPYNADGTPKRKSLNKVRGTAFREEKKKLSNTSPLISRVNSFAKTKVAEGAMGVMIDTAKGSKKSKDTGVTSDKKLRDIRKVYVGASYQPEVDVIDEVRANQGMGDLAKKMNLDPNKPGDYMKLKRLLRNQGKDKAMLSMGEAKMTSAEKDKKEKYVKGMKKDKGGFTKRYGKDGESVMYATATKMAMKEAKVDKGKDDAAKQNERNQRSFGNRRDSKGSMASTDDTEARRYNTKKGRGVKMKGKKDKTPVNYHKKDSQARVDALLKSMKEDFYRKKYDVKDGGYKKTNKMTKSNKRAGDSKAQNRELHIDLKKYKLKKLKTEGSLHKWFKGSKSKDGKPGWVNVVTGGTCASDKPGEGTPKCVSSSKRASMSKAERASASRRKKKADPGQQSKSGAAKPTYVSTDKKK